MPTIINNNFVSVDDNSPNNNSLENIRQGAYKLEIIDLLEKYRKNKKLSAEFLGRGGAWLDTGSIEDFYKTSAFVSAIENRQGFKIACLEEIAFNKGWLDRNEIRAIAEKLNKNSYGRYLFDLIKV